MHLNLTSSFVAGMSDSIDETQPENIALPREFLDANHVLATSGRREHTIVPGIYFTPSANGTETSAHAARTGKSEECAGPRYTEVDLLGKDELSYQERELSKRVAKLKSSNEEMLEFDPEGKDSDLVEARAENEGAINRDEERLEMIRNRLRLLNSVSPLL